MVNPVAFRGLYNISCAATAELLPFAARAQLPLAEFVEVVGSGTGARLGGWEQLMAGESGVLGLANQEISGGFRIVELCFNRFQEVSGGFKLVSLCFSVFQEVS